MCVCVCVCVCFVQETWEGGNIDSVIGVLLKHLVSENGIYTHMVGENANFTHQVGENSEGVFADVASCSTGANGSSRVVTPFCL